MLWDITPPTPIRKDEEAVLGEDGNKSDVEDKESESKEDRGSEESGNESKEKEDDENESQLGKTSIEDGKES
jgi:hypothetical protein